jgi:uncharacterized protein (TIGR02265 family)
VQKLVWESAVEGLFIRGVARRMTPALRDELRANGLDLSARLPPGLPSATWYACLNSAAKHLCPELSRAEAMRALGHLTIEGIAHTFWGKAFAPAAALLGPRRLLTRLPGQIRSTNNFAQGVLTEVSTNELKLEVSDVGDAPEMLQGSLERLASWAGAKEVQVTFTFEEPPTASYLVRWSSG